MFRFILPLLFAASAIANEPSWLPQQRAELRDAVIQGMVAKVKRVKTLEPPYQAFDLMSAEIRIDRVAKQHDSLPAHSVTVYYLSSPEGANMCPRLPVIALDQRSFFYLSFGDYHETKKVFFIGMGSDVIEVQ